MPLVLARRRIGDAVTAAMPAAAIVETADMVSRVALVAVVIPLGGTAQDNGRGAEAGCRRPDVDRKYSLVCSVVPSVSTLESRFEICLERF